MCDYSLENKASRPAVVGDELEMNRCHGFTAVGDIETLVCLRPGTELQIKGAYCACSCDHEYTHQGVTNGPARFRQVNAHLGKDTHHDAVELADGTLVLLAAFGRGGRTTAKVLQLPPDEKDLAAMDARVAAALKDGHDRPTPVPPTPVTAPRTLASVARMFF